MRDSPSSLYRSSSPSLEGQSHGPNVDPTSSSKSPYTKLHHWNSYGGGPTIIQRHRNRESLNPKSHIWTDIDKYKDPVIDAKEILLSEDEKQRLYAPWIHSIIIKPVNSKFNHQYLKRKFQDLWKLPEPLCLIDLGRDFFHSETIKIGESIHDPQWRSGFVAGRFISIRK